MTPTPKAPVIDDYFIPDGFVYTAAIRPALPYDTRGLALKRMRALRLSSYRPYVHCTRNFTIAPYSNVQTQIRMLAGTYLWGYWFNVIPANPGTPAVSPHNMYVKVTDSATGSGPFGDWMSDQDLNSFIPSQVAGIGYIAYPQLLLEPYVVTDPGMFQVEFSNNGKAGETAIVQMQFFASVPCDRPKGTADLEQCL